MPMADLYPQFTSSESDYIRGSSPRVWSPYILIPVYWDHPIIEHKAGRLNCPVRQTWVPSPVSEVRPYMQWDAGPGWFLSESRSDASAVASGRKLIWLSKKQCNGIIVWWAAKNNLGETYKVWKVTHMGTFISVQSYSCLSLFKWYSGTLGH